MACEARLQAARPAPRPPGQGGRRRACSRRRNARVEARTRRARHHRGRRRTDHPLARRRRPRAGDERGMGGRVRGRPHRRPGSGGHAGASPRGPGERADSIRAGRKESRRPRGERPDRAWNRGVRGAQGGAGGTLRVRGG